MTITFTLQGNTPTTIAATDIIKFAGPNGFADQVLIGQYQDTMHIETSVGVDKSSGNVPKNSKYVSSTTVDIGAGAVALSGISTANCPLKINLTHGSSVIIISHILYAYDGTTTTAVPTGVDFRCAEQGDSTWTEAEGSAAALGVTDDTTGTSHDFYFLISASPSSVGTKTAFTIREEFIYS